MLSTTLNNMNNTLFAIAACLVLYCIPVNATAQWGTPQLVHAPSASTGMGNQRMEVGELDGSPGMEIAHTVWVEASAGVFEEAVELVHLDAAGNPAHKSIAVSGFALHTVAQLNAGGSPDLILRTWEPEFYVAYNNGDGTFTAPELADFIPENDLLIARDLNGDGIDELLQQSHSQVLGNPYRLMVSGPDGYVPFDLGLVTNNSLGHYLAVFDWQADGDLDVAVRTGEDQINIARNESGTFVLDSLMVQGMPVAVLNTDVGLVPQISGDLNGDGRDDLVVHGDLDGQEGSVQLNQQVDGSLVAAPQTFTAAPYTGFLQTLLFDDLDGNGISDRVHIPSTSDYLQAEITMNATTPFTASTPNASALDWASSGTLEGVQLRALQAADADGDGRKELFVLFDSVYNLGQMAMVRQSANGQFSETIEIGINPIVFNQTRNWAVMRHPEGLKGTSINNATLKTTYPWYAQELSSPSVSEDLPQPLDVFPSTSKPDYYVQYGANTGPLKQGILPIDVDLDGTDECFFFPTDQDTDVKHFLRWNPDGSMDAQVVGGTQSSTSFTNGYFLAEHMYPADVEGDGILEIFMRLEITGGAMPYMRLENGVWGTATLDPVDFEGELIAAGDFNGDGLADWASDQGTFYLGDGMGGTTELTPTNSGFVTSLGDEVMHVGDMDGNPGDELVVRTDDGLAVVTLYATQLNTIGELDADGVWYNRRHTSVWADVDNDGTTDLVRPFTTPAGEHLIETYLNDGSGQLSLAVGLPGLATFDSEDEPFPVAYASLNGQDGLFVGLSGSGAVYFLPSGFDAPQQVQASVFVDLNANGVQDMGETLIPAVPFQLNNQNVYFYSGSSGALTLGIPTPGTVTVSTSFNPEFWNWTTPTSSTVQVDAGESTSVSFGLAPVDLEDHLNVEVVLMDGPCGDEAWGEITIQNQGATEPLTDLTFTMNTLFELGSTEPTGVVSGNSVEWAVPQLGLFEAESFWFTFTRPDVDYIGNIFTHSVTVDADGLALVDQNIYEVLECSYDPNDKQVDLIGFGEEGYIPLDTDRLEYTVRFQNTGTAPAFDVRIKDALDAGLKPGSLQLEAVSHEVEITVVNDTAVFYFENILLPDSASDPLGSQGYVRFSVELEDDLPVGTLVTNTADIYFDLNAPIVTNTVSNTLFTCDWLYNEPLVILVEDGTVTTNYSNSPFAPADQWNWAWENEWLDTAPTIQWNGDGQYFVSVEMEGGCVLEGASTLVGVSEINQRLRVYPNPTKGLIEWQAIVDQAVLRDRLGRIVLSKRQVSALDLSGFEAGVYLIELIQGNASHMETVVLE